LRLASIIGFWVMIGLGIAAFAWADAWWQTALLIVAALGVGWYSLGLYARAATKAAERARQFEATAEDEELLREVGARGHEEAFRVARENDEAR
jgi:hypothetical protein